ncbi:MAG: hypothetical protein CL847_05005 [Crocinitomicaceae bacterium]|nr:hypothetical protein [Crocinitomicaceae bacterium]|tara:strand:- start:3140 stop:3769 length:630 start_codon:yes stop_codon:yes gene_type:complete
MTKLGTILISLAFVAITSCGDSQNNQGDNSNNKDQAESPLGRELTEAEKRGMRLMKSRQDAQKRNLADKSKNKTSTYRYLASSDEYPIFSNLLKKSSISKHIHRYNVTVLAPVDNAFEAYPQYKDLLLPGNEAVLDEFISYHVVNESLEYKSFSDGTSWTVHAGPTLELSKQGGIYFGGAHVRSGCIETEKGAIIGMDDIIYFPELEGK